MHFCAFRKEAHFCRRLLQKIYLPIPHYKYSTRIMSTMIIVIGSTYQVGHKNNIRYISERMCVNFCRGVIVTCSWHNNYYINNEENRKYFDMVYMNCNICIRLKYSTTLYCVIRLKYSNLTYPWN